jgi:hypothetical protein
MTCKHGIYPDPNGDTSVIGCLYCDQEAREHSNRNFGRGVLAVVIGLVLMATWSSAKEQGKDEGKRYICNQLAVPVDDCPTEY